MKTVNLELSKQLKEAGYNNPNTKFGWVAGCLMAFPETTIWEYPSPTADEILDLLPNYISEYPNGFYLTLRKNNEEERGDKYSCFYAPAQGNVKKYNLANEDENSIADAAAKMWLYLKKENLL